MPWCLLITLTRPQSLRLSWRRHGSGRTVCLFERQSVDSLRKTKRVVHLRGAEMDNILVRVFQIPTRECLDHLRIAGGRVFIVVKDQIAVILENVGHLRRRLYL